RAGRSLTAHQAAEPNRSKLRSAELLTETKHSRYALNAGRDARAPVITQSRRRLRQAPRAAGGSVTRDCERGPRKFSARLRQSTSRSQNACLRVANLHRS